MAINISTNQISQPAEEGVVLVVKEGGVSALK